MSEQSIYDKSVVIRNETQEYANTRGRVADVLDDINFTKANKEDVDAAIQLVLEELDITEAELYAYIDARNSEQDIEIEKKLDKPQWVGYEQHYFVISSQSNINLRPITLYANQVPYWSGNTFLNTQIYTTSGGFIGIGTSSPTERLEVNGNAKVNALYLPVNNTSATAYRLRSDGTNLYYADGSAVENRLAFIGKFFEHNVKGKRVELIGNGGTLNIDLNSGSHFTITLIANTTLAISNMVGVDETQVFTMTISGAFSETLPTIWKRDTYSDVNDDLSKIREYEVNVKKGGTSPLIRFNMIKVAP